MADSHLGLLVHRGQMLDQRLLITEALAVAQLAHERHAEELLHIHLVNISLQHVINNGKYPPLILVGGVVDA